tara:strand:- start:233 stop:349 length:117 start_codon:yes stop_codon:yes gene_type:complete
MAVAIELKYFNSIATAILFYLKLSKIYGFGVKVTLNLE